MLNLKRRTIAFTRKELSRVNIKIIAWLVKLAALEYEQTKALPGTTVADYCEKHFNEIFEIKVVCDDADKIPLRLYRDLVMQKDGVMVIRHKMGGV